MYPAASTLTIGLDIFGLPLLRLLCSPEVFFMLRLEIFLIDWRRRVFFALENLHTVGSP